MLGHNLMELRKKHGYSQQEIADMLSVSRQTISNWESGQGAPALDKAYELARIYKISLDDLVGNEVRSMAENQKEKDTHVLKKAIGRICILDCSDWDVLLWDGAEEDASGNIRVKILDVNGTWIKIEYTRRKEGTIFQKETAQRLVDLSKIHGIRFEEGEYGRSFFC
ncbi:MAG TPA: helix-turn-helix domain-containing protein [Candidatus Mediterraneibacter intestinipullorum]|nr:helix-turn-helix domain-containing protein [Candidatus Mediterraneibacter intestinipullorum]